MVASSLCLHARIARRKFFSSYGFHRQRTNADCQIVATGLCWIKTGVNILRFFGRRHGLWRVCSQAVDMLSNNGTSYPGFSAWDGWTCRNCAGIKGVRRVWAGITVDRSVVFPLQGDPGLFACRTYTPGRHMT